ncbi:XRE family transcriptional regulator [Bradyrhizobium sp. SZCCHNR3058]|uniref:XRE family transcriptional regulator n=1 Tax=Bradyrhizobium sp. SZCCHNR3058 TaxID=3057423 RepID=UPI002915EE04|nr:S24 family peptidase [Bradyrhizobium sp. SZCCHNR3058]
MKIGVGQLEKGIAKVVLSIGRTGKRNMAKAAQAERKHRVHPKLETIKERVEARVMALQISRNELSRRAGLGLSYVNDLLSGKSLNPTKEGLMKLAPILDCDYAYLVGEQPTPRINENGNGSQNLAGREPDTSTAKSIPLYQIGLTDPDGFFALNNSRRTPWTMPVSNDDMYCITVPDDTMAPRFRVGEVVIVNPNKPVAHGGFAVVRQTDDRVAIREVVTISLDKISVRMLSDAATIDIPRAQVKSLDRIIGSCELV